MRIKSIAILFCLITLLSANVAGQEFNNYSWNKFTTSSNSLNYKLPGTSFMYQTPFYLNEFLNEDWTPGYVLLENGDRYDSLYLNYNSFIDELVLYNSIVGGLIQLDKYAIKEFSLKDENGQDKIFKKIDFGEDKTDERYLEILHSGKIKLLIWYKTEELNTPLYYDLSGSSRNSKLMINYRYYIDSTDDGLIKINPIRSSLLELFPDQKKAIRRVLRRNHLRNKYETPDDFLKAVQLIESEILN